jgi:hypothetical protein
MLDIMLDTVIDDMKLNHLDTKRTNCPSCGGYNTLTCTYNASTNNYVYNCYRNSCGFKGAISAGGSMDTLYNLRKHREASSETSRPITIPTYLQSGVTTQEGLEWLSKNGALLAYTQGLYKIYTDLKEGRLVIPLYEANKLVNLMGRAWGINTTPKVKIYYKGSNVPPFIVGMGKTLVIVEDFASAANVATIQGCVGYCILGTQFSLEAHITKLAAYNPTSIIVALDRDALLKASKIVSALQSYFDVVQLLPIKKDIKYYQSSELQELLQ